MDGTRTPQPGERMRVHVNLHRGDFSVTDPKADRVIAHVRDITLTEVEFRVQAGCQERARRENRRQVCAYAVGLVAAVNTAPDVSGWHRVTLRRMAATFTFHQRLSADGFDPGGEPVQSASLVVFAGKAGWVPPDTGHLGGGRLGTRPAPATPTLFG